MPTRVLSYTPDKTGGRRAGARESEEWGAHPVVIFAMDSPVLVNAQGSGSMELRVGDALFLRARDFIELKPGGQGTLVGVETLGTQPCRFFVADAADPWGRRQNLELLCTPFADQLPTYWKACYEIHCLLESALRQAKGSSNPTEPALRNVLRLAAIECERALASFQEFVRSRVEKSNRARVIAAEAYISLHIDRDIRKSELAEHIGVSVSQLTLAFREIGQLSVRDRIRFHRVESARNLLTDTSLSVSEVADRVGMNYRHFIRAFRQSALLTPLRYRKYARRKEKSTRHWEEFVHTENFGLVEALTTLNGDGSEASSRQGAGAVSVLVSNTSSDPVRVSRLSGGGEFIEIGVATPEKRLTFLDTPGGIWKLRASKHASSDSGREPVYFKSGETNSHFVYGLG